VLAGIVGLIVKEPQFLRSEWLLISILAALYLAHLGISLYRYRRLSAFHAYTMKTAAVLQGLFLVHCFFAGQPSPLLFYLATGFTAIGLIEEVVLMFLLKGWTTDVRGIYWVMKQRKTAGDGDAGKSGRQSGGEGETCCRI
jgi:CDP-diacylglycerol--glycerol-3-phosphate 3-phosphatidyltransferase